MPSRTRSRVQPSLPGGCVERLAVRLLLALLPLLQATPPMPGDPRSESNRRFPGHPLRGKCRGRPPGRDLHHRHGQLLAAPRAIRRPAFRGGGLLSSRRLGPLTAEPRDRGGRPRSRGRRVGQRPQPLRQPTVLRLSAGSSRLRRGPEAAPHLSSGRGWTSFAALTPRLPWPSAERLSSSAERLASGWRRCSARWSACRQRMRRSGLRKRPCRRATPS
mmetsp:Transcript_28114/g.61377  ORF Transcript_28114/g.61377 Transcript_28114/m.61377 type:complete len:218 (+) Transcript_28114:233-886(+)